MKTVRVPAKVMDILNTQLADIQILADQRESEIEEAMDEQAERKYMTMSEIKKKFVLKLKIAEKAGEDMQQIRAM